MVHGHRKREKESTKCFDCDFVDFNGAWPLTERRKKCHGCSNCVCALHAKSNYTVSTCLKQNNVTLEASLGYYSRPVKGCVRFCVCVCACIRECVSVLGYTADIRLYPSFHQLSEEESSGNTLQSDPRRAHADTHTCALFNTHGSRKKKKRPSYFNASRQSTAQNLTAAFH